KSRFGSGSSDCPGQREVRPGCKDGRACEARAFCKAFARKACRSGQGEPASQGGCRQETEQTYQAFEAGCEKEGEYARQGQEKGQVRRCQICAIMWYAALVVIATFSLILLTLPVWAQHRGGGGGHIGGGGGTHFASHGGFAGRSSAVHASGAF